MKKFIAEILGTFSLLFFGCSAIIFMGEQIGFVGISFAFGFTLLGVIYGLGPISGAHLNPAVSLAAYMNGRMGGGEMVQYWIAQVIGGILASILLMAMSGDVNKAVTVGSFGVFPAFMFEIVGTFFLVTVILGVTQDEKSSAFAGIVIGSVLVMIHLAGISLSGAAVNPVRAIATNIYDANLYGGLWVYLVGPMLGGGLAGFIHKIGLTRAGD